MIYSITKPKNTEYVLLKDNIYKLFFRTDIRFDEGKKIYEFNEYTLITELSSDDIEADINANYDKYISLAKLVYDEHEKETKIHLSEKELALSDYKVLKTLENYSLGLPLPYDYSELISKRQELRDIINNLQGSGTDLSEDVVLDQCRLRKITEMCAICQTTITNGIDYNDEHYRLNTTDQINLTSLYTLAQTGRSVPYHADGKVCRMFAPEEFIPLVQQGIQWVTYHTTYYNLLKNQIANMESIEDIQAVTYGMELKPEYQAIINAIVGGAA